MNNFHQKPTSYVNLVALKVSNLDKSVNFYKNILGFKVLSSNDNKVELTADGKKPLVVLEPLKNPQTSRNITSGLYHLALLLPERKYLASFLKHIADAKYPIGASDHHVSEAIYLNDPDGNGIEIYSDRDPSDWKHMLGNVYMTTEALDVESLMTEPYEPWVALPEETIMGHIHLQVSDLKASGDFYMKGLGFQLVLPYYKALFLSDGGYHHHIALNSWSGTNIPKADNNSLGLSYYSIVYGDDSIREKQLSALRAIGATVVKKEDYYLTYDPSGIEIHLSV